MAEKYVPINQTQFSFEEPIFENQPVYPQEEPKVETPKPKSKKKLFIILGVVGFILLVIILGLVVALRNRTKTVQVEEETPVVVQKELSPLQKRIEESRELLELADPTKQDLAFPPIDLTIRLDPRER